MKKIDWLLAGIGLAVASFLTWHAYHANAHRDVAQINEYIYIVLFPPSLGLMATENASKAGQVFIVLTVVSANGFLYCLVAKAVRHMLRLGEGR
jgi:FtsH-binding integral membrane protein